jgi:amino acid adenylation domain-containing protein
MSSDQHLALSFAQQRLWLVEQLAPNSAAYLTGRLHRIAGPLDADALERALWYVLDRHRVLRTRLVQDGELPSAVFEPAPAVSFDRRDLSGTVEAEARGIALADELATAPMDFAREPLFRAGLIGLGPEDNLFWYTAHHIVFDGVSRLIVEQELSGAYALIREGQTPKGPRLETDYYEIAARQREQSQDRETSRQLEYWRDHLAGMPLVSELPTDFERPALPTTHGADIRFEIDAAITERIGTLARECRTTPFVVALACYQALLGFHARADDVPVGVPFAGRGDPDCEGLVGFFVNTVVQRGDLSGDPTFQDLLARTRDCVLDALDYQDVPFEMVVEHLGGGGHASHNPLFQHWFDWSDENLPLTAAGGGLSLPGLGCTTLEMTDPTVRFDLELHLSAGTDRLDGRLCYSTELFTEATANLLATSYRRLLSRVPAEPGTRLSELVRLTAEDERGLLELGRGRASSAPSDWTLVASFYRAADATPDATAVVSAGEELSYAQLRDRAEALAGALRRRGIRGGNVVAVVLPRAELLIPAMLGALMAGAAYAPIDARQPPARIQSLLADSEASLLLTSEQVAEALRELETPPAITLEQWPEGGERTLPAPPAPEELCYLIFTSGSTGTPKGVAVSHRTLGNLVAWHLRRYPLGPGDRVMQVASISFDAAVWEIWPALVSGAAVELADEALVHAPGQLAGAFAAHGTTVTFAPTALAEELIRESLTGLRVLLTGGDLFRPQERADPGVAVVNHYGPTENTVVSTATEALRAPWSTVSLGTPIDGVRAYVLDEIGRLVPRGTVGELHLGGLSVTQGYLHRPRATAETFLPDPFSDLPGARMYRTGDLVRWRDDGTLHFAGRTDQQVKIRGYRIELGEIEAALLSHPSLRACAVIAHDDGSARRMLVAYHVPVRGQGSSAEEYRAHLRARLPEYMVPSLFVAMEELPFNVAGKLDRARLPAPDVARAPFQAPRTDGERTVAELWRDVLSVERVGAEDDFFAIGGTSMAAARFAVRAQETFGIELSLRDVFEHRTISALARLAEQRLESTIAAMSTDEIRAALSASLPR